MASREGELKLLISRTDRLGDVLLALPALQLLRESLPEAELTFLAREGPLEAIAPYLAASGVRAERYREGGDLRLEGYDAALVMFEAKDVLGAAKRARIPLRVGPLTRPGTLLRLTHPVRQARSRGEKNEAEYNLELARKLTAHLGMQVREPVAVEIPSEVEAMTEASAALSAAGVSQEERFLILHPGMGGSAANLSAASYVRLLGDLEKQLPVRAVLSVGPAERDREIGEAILRERPELGVLRGISIAGLREAFRRALLVVAPSTGPLHLAHFVGCATLGLYSPVRSQRAERWQPWGGTGKSFVLAPRVECPGSRRCLGEACELFFCLDRMSWQGMIRELSVDKLLRRPS